MRAEYDFSNARKNPYAKKLKKQITINIDSDTTTYHLKFYSHPDFGAWMRNFRCVICIPTF